MQENTVFVRRYHTDDNRFFIREREIWRYSGYRGLKNGIEQELQDILAQVIKELQNGFSYKVCYRKIKITWENGVPNFPDCIDYLKQSNDLTKCLKGSDEIIVFGATIGLELDRMIAKYQRISPTKALLMQAYGAERIECLCDVFCNEIKEELQKEGVSCTARFSPGYGDLPLEAQKQIFALLDCQRQIGLTLNDSLLMTPSKSVTAIFGIGSCIHNVREKNCKICQKNDCAYRRIDR